MTSIRSIEASRTPLRSASISTAGADIEPAPLDIYEDRKDVVGYKKKRSKLLPFRHKFEITHPAGSASAGDKNVIIIDLDELGTTGTASGSAGGASVGQLVFLSGLTVLAFYGTYSSISAFIDATEKLRDLRIDKAKLKEAFDAARTPGACPPARMLADNKRSFIKAHVDRIFMGAFGGAGATLVGTSILANAKMLGSFSPALASAAMPLMYAAAPLVTIFGTGIASYEAYRIARTFEVSRAMQAALGNNQVGNEREAMELLAQRLKALRVVSGIKGAAYLGLAVGVPMAVFGGPYGLPVMVISAGAMVGVGILEGVVTAYQPQLTLQEQMALKDTHAIINDLAQTHAQNSKLKALRREKHLRYPHGAHALFPVKYLVRGTAAVRRALRKHRDEPTAESTVFECMRSFSNIERQRARDEVKTALLRAAKSHAGMPAEVDAAREELRAVRAERHLLLAQLATELSNEAKTFLLVQFLIRTQVFPAFGVEMLKHKSLREAFSTQDATEYHFDANRLVEHMKTAVAADADAVLQHVFQIAEKVLLLAEGKRTLWRQRHLLDILAQEITA